MKTFNSLLLRGLLVLSTLFVVVSCSTEDEVTVVTPPEDLEISSVYTISEDETWEAGRTVNLGNHVVIQKGATLTIEPGVKVLVDKNTVPEFLIEGNLHALGTADAPIYFTVPDADRTEANIFNLQAWGGFICTATAETFVLNHVVMEFANGILTDEHISIQKDLGFEVGEPSYGFYSENSETKVVVHNSVIAYMVDDAFRPEGGQISFYNNVFAFIGATGGEALNIKAGTTGDVAYNLFYHIATNGPKWSNKNGEAVQTNINAYNNTIVSSGWRRSKSGRGGSVNVEEGAKGKIHNNVIVNCRYGVRIVGDAETGETNVDLANTTIGNQFYYGYNDIIKNEFAPSNGVLKEVSTSSITSGKPGFVNFDVDAFSISAIEGEEAFYTPSENVKFDDWKQYDFHLSSGSQLLGKGSDQITPMNSFSIGGQTFSVPASSDYIGAFGTK
ncbi:hypothetical protein [Flammeovirga sp. SJP92]|uniref:hypothetical protein n=1 Tax=Flammeovirga sp. SJP92 TaxID=1775430 RepID=UPI00078930E4|nr:hypothetical protein [Flammeovirga sp. SJP92]KXX66527.1 hypothetical protein AVL50_31880 [Flammeovirga sp. SJP92]